MKCSGKERGVKNCVHCGQSKSIGDFYLSRGSPVGKCKICTRADVAAYRASNIADIRAYDRKRGEAPERRAATIQRIASWERDHRDRKNAGKKLRYAVAIGRVIRWPVCAMPDCSAAPEAHHPDYAEPLSHPSCCTSRTWREHERRESND